MTNRGEGAAERNMLMSRTPNINNVQIAGNVVRESDVHEVGDSHTLRIDMAHDHPYKDKKGQWQNFTSYFEVELWGGLVDRYQQYCKKGTPVIIEGSLKQDRWEDKDFKKRARVRLRATKLHILEYPEK